ncbi:MAG: hypothetical protein ACREHG_10210 [Candidatus Saccharimonadales bacterium]
MQIKGKVTAGTGNRTPSAVHPTVAYLLILVVVEYTAYCLLHYVFRSHHGG